MGPFIKALAIDQAERLTYPDGSVTADIVAKAVRFRSHRQPSPKSCVVS
jgi:hypothetical protein